MSYFLLVLGCVCFAAFGMIKFHEAETAVNNELVTRVNEVSNAIVGIRERADAQHRLINAANENASFAKAEVEKMQDHFHHLRKNQILLQDKLSRRKPVVQFQGAVPVEIVGGKAPTKSNWERLKRASKQVKELSK